MGKTDEDKAIEGFLNWVVERHRASLTPQERAEMDEVRLRRYGKTFREDMLASDEQREDVNHDDE